MVEKGTLREHRVFGRHLINVRVRHVPWRTELVVEVCLTVLEIVPLSVEGGVRIPLLRQRRQQ